MCSGIVCSPKVLTLNCVYMNCNMFEPEPYFRDPVPPMDCVSDDDDYIIDVVGIHYFEQDNVGLCYRVNWKKNRNIGVWVPAKSMKNIVDGLLLWKIHMLLFLYSACRYCYKPLLLRPEHQLNVSYVIAMNTRERCEKTHLPYPSGTDSHVNQYEHCTRKVIRKIYCECTFPKEYGGLEHYLVAWEAPHEDSHCWLTRGQLWGIITCEGMRRIQNWACRYRDTALFHTTRDDANHYDDDDDDDW